MTNLQRETFNQLLLTVMQNPSFVGQCLHTVETLLDQIQEPELTVVYIYWTGEKSVQVSGSISS